MDKSYFLIIPFVIMMGTTVYIGYFLTGMNSFIDFLFMPDCAHPLFVLGIAGLYYLYKNGKVKKKFNLLLSYICALTISIGTASLFYSFYVKNFLQPLSLFCHISMIVIGLFIFSRNLNNLKITGFFIAFLFLSLDLISDLFLGTRHPYIYSNQDIINGFAVRTLSIVLLSVFLFIRKKLK